MDDCGSTEALPPMRPEGPGLPVPAHIELDLSSFRRVLAVSDVHGEYGQLQRRLDEMDYDDRRDALIIDGDLVDRGPESMEALAWRKRRNVHCGLGNHDLMPQMFLDGDAQLEDIREWGGQWFIDLDEDERRRVAALLRDAPVAMTVRTPVGRTVGFVHADCPQDWDSLIDILENPRDYRFARTVNDCLWSRNTIVELLNAVGTEDGPPRPYSCRMENIDHVFHGHTTIMRAFAHHDRTWMDTGACFPGGRLTVIDVDQWLDDIDRNSPFV